MENLKFQKGHSDINWPLQTLLYYRLSNLENPEKPYQTLQFWEFKNSAVVHSTQWGQIISEVTVDFFPSCSSEFQYSLKHISIFWYVNFNVWRWSTDNNVWFIKIQTILKMSLWLYYDFFWQIIISYCKFLMPRP